MKRWYVKDVMTEWVITVTPDTPYKRIADLLVANGISAVPVIDDHRRVLGVVSEADLLAKLEFAEWAPRHPLARRHHRDNERRAAADTAGELMTTPPITTHPTDTVTQAARLMDKALVTWLPVIDAEERLVGVIARRDLIRLYTRTDEQLRTTVINDLLGALWIDPKSVQVEVRSGVVTLRGRVDRRSTATIATQFVRATPGVVDVVDELGFEFDDDRLAHSLHYSRTLLRP